MPWKVSTWPRCLFFLMSIFSNYFLLRAFYTWCFCQSGKEWGEWMESRFMNHLIYADLYAINHVRFGFSAEESKRVQSWWYWKSQAMEGGSRYDGGKQQEISHLSRVQGSEKWQCKINQHFKAPWWDQPHLKFLKGEEIFAHHPTKL